MGKRIARMTCVTGPCWVARYPLLAAYWRGVYRHLEPRSGGRSYKGRLSNPPLPILIPRPVVVDLQLVEDGLF